METGRRLLLADDSITIQKVVNLTFADEGMEVTAVGNGDLAIEKIEEIAPDIILADIHMPGLNGYQVCEFVKRNERFRHIPVMLLVGSFEPFNEAEARRVGADDYLTKPFQSIRQLVNRVGSLLSGKSSTNETPTKELESTREVNIESEEQGGQVPLASTAPISTEMAEGSATLGEATPSAFADPSLDDSMIEATPAHDFNMSPTMSGGGRGTTPLSAAEIEQAAAIHGQHSAIHTQDTLRMYVKNEVPESVAVSSPVSGQPALSGRAFNADDALLDLGDVEPQMSTSKEDDFILDIWDDAPVQATSPAVVEIDDEVVQYVGDVTEVPSPAVQLFETMAGNEMPVAESMPVRVYDEDVVPVEPVAEPRAASQPLAGLITLEQISPEVIDAIARRAVEQLSEKVIEQIAWEVVPDLAERLIKRRLEEEGKS